MSKIIKVTDEMMEGLRADFEKALASSKFSDGKFSFSKTLGASDEKAELDFTETAWYKMQLLVQNFSTEVGWHGIAKRGEEENTYIVEDILVYPQVVTGATINPDQVEYEQWLMGLDDDEFNNLRFQGHSHVNMGVTPSGVDLALYDKLLSQLDDSMFYIFLITNKKNDRYIKIYDMSKNILFETTDITVRIVDDGLGFAEFLNEAKEKVKEQSRVVTVNAAQTYTPKISGGDTKSPKASSVPEKGFGTAGATGKTTKSGSGWYDGYGGKHAGYSDDYDYYGYGDGYWNRGW